MKFILLILLIYVGGAFIWGTYRRIKKRDLRLTLQEERERIYTTKIERIEHRV